MTSPHRHLLGIEDLSARDIVQYLDTAEVFFDVSRRRVRKVPTLRGKTVINLFYEASTRTRTSFELAGKRLSADVVNISVSASSVSKGESLLDTVRNLEAMRPDVLVVRHAASGAPHLVARHARAAVVNAGDGTHEHPTQALLDAFTIRRAKGRIAGLVVTIAGDIAHSRVARSNAALLTRRGATVRFCAPRRGRSEDLQVQLLVERRALLGRWRRRAARRPSSGARGSCPPRARRACRAAGGSPAPRCPPA